MLIYQDSKSTFGGMFSSSKIRIKKTPRNVTKEEIMGITLFNKMIIVKLLTDNLNGGSFKFPKIR